jgi:hypothetical protein
MSIGFSAPRVTQKVLLVALKKVVRADSLLLDISTISNVTRPTLSRVSRNSSTSGRTLILG